MEIEKFVYLSRLYSTYREILTPKQREVLDFYLDEDLSLGEISEEMGVSRQAVHDAIKRSEQILLNYESKLGVVSREEFVSEKMNEIIQIMDPIDDIDPVKRENILRICKELI